MQGNEIKYIGGGLHGITSALIIAIHSALCGCFELLALFRFVRASFRFFYTALLGCGVVFGGSFPRLSLPRPNRKKNSAETVGTRSPVLFGIMIKDVKNELIVMMRGMPVHSIPFPAGVVLR
jgi:hypothetical protein